jgi:excisionase family DNA binding protein
VSHCGCPTGTDAPAGAERVYTLRQAASIKAVSEDTLRRAIRSAVGNVLPAKIIGRGYRIKASDLDAWYEALEDA